MCPSNTHYEFSIDPHTLFFFLLQITKFPNHRFGLSPNVAENLNSPPLDAFAQKLYKPHPSVTITFIWTKIHNNTNKNHTPTQTHLQTLYSAVPPDARPLVSIFKRENFHRIFEACCVRLFYVRWLCSWCCLSPFGHQSTCD